MPWKRDVNDALALDEHGDPIWIDESGERSVDYPSMSAALSRADREAAERENRLRELESRCEAVGHIDDLSGWLSQAEEALELMKELTDKGQSLDDHVRECVEKATAALSEQLAEAEESRRRDRETLARGAIEAAFARSEFVRLRLVSATLAADLFSGRFVVDDQGRLVCQEFDDFENLSFDEALARLVDGYPGRDFIYKGGAGCGSGARSRPGGARGGSRRLTDCRTEDDKLNYLNSVGA